MYLLLHFFGIYISNFRLYPKVTYALQKKSVNHIYAKFHAIALPQNMVYQFSLNLSIVHALRAI